MSLFSGLFTLPLGAALGAYKQIHLKIPLEERNFSSSAGIDPDDPICAQRSSTFSGSHIKRGMEPFLDKVNIRKDLIFIEVSSLGFASALGTNIFKNGDAVILVAPGFYEADKDACNFVMKHEISHIKNNDLFTMHGVPCVCQLAASIFGMHSLSFWLALGISFTVGIVSRALFSQWREAKADDFAIANSSEQELKGGRRFFIAIQQLNIEERNTFWKRIAFSATGNTRLDILHPSTTSRIQKIEGALRNRNIDIDTEEERGKLDGQFKTFITNTQRGIK